MTENVKRIKSRVINKHETEADWKKAVNFIPEKAEHIVYDIDENYDYERLKIGDGVTPVNDLPFIEEKLIIPSTNIVHGEENTPISDIIDNLKNNNQSDLTFDETPTEGSENLVKSGAIYEAIENKIVAQIHFWEDDD